jgi:hypothetical protein
VQSCLRSQVLNAVAHLTGNWGSQGIACHASRPPVSWRRGVIRGAGLPERHISEVLKFLVMMVELHLGGGSVERLRDIVVWGGVGLGSRRAIFLAGQMRILCWWELRGG